MAVFKQKEMHLIEDVKVLKILTDPLRVKIIEQLLDEPRTVKAIATEFGIQPHKLYYHFKMMEKNGLIAVAHTQIVSGIIEKHYQTVARDYQLKPSILSNESGQKDEALEYVLRTVFDNGRYELKKSFEAGLVTLSSDKGMRPTVDLTHSFTRLTDEDFDAVNDKLKEIHQLIRDRNCTSADENAKTYTLTIAFYPTVSKQS